MERTTEQTKIYQRMSTAKRVATGCALHDFAFQRLFAVLKKKNPAITDRQIKYLPPRGCWVNQQEFFEHVLKTLEQLRMEIPMWRAATALILATAILMTSSCTHVNPQVQPSDVPMTVTLNKKLIQDNTHRTKPGNPKSRSVQSSGGFINGFSGTGDIRADLAIVVVAVVLYAVFDAPSSGERPSSNNESLSCDMQMWPLGHQAQYAQRLKWGKNKVWFPQMLNGDNVPIIVRTSGDYMGQFMLYLPIRPDGIETLKHGNPPPAWEVRPDISVRPIPAHHSQ